MSEELSYINHDGDSVHTSQYLRNRKSCCKTFCLHCPYGTTLNKYGLIFEKISSNPESLSKANLIIKEAEGSDTLGTSMIESAFGGKKQTKISKFNFEKYIQLSLKGQICGIARLKGSEVMEVFLTTHFKDQGLDLSLIADLYRDQQG